MEYASLAIAPITYYYGCKVFGAEPSILETVTSSLVAPAVVVFANFNIGGSNSDVDATKVGALSAAAAAGSGYFFSGRVENAAVGAATVVTTIAAHKLIL